MANEAKLVVVAVIAAVVVGLSLFLQPWAELGFGLDKKEIPQWSHVIVDSKPFQDLNKQGQDTWEFLKSRSSAPNDMSNLVAGDYTYALVMSIAMVLAALAIIFVGRDDAEEKTVLPVKK